MQHSDDLRTGTLITCTAIGYSGAIMRVGARERRAAHVWDELEDAYVEETCGLH